MRAPWLLRGLAVVAMLGVLGVLGPRAAEAQRFAVIIGNNAGRPQERALEFAERDASRMADVLTSVGNVRPDQLVLVQGATAATAREALIATNERIRSQADQLRQADQSSLLIVYYSGHSDAEALHLGDTNLSLSEIEGLVRGSSARIRVLIVDSCRSGVLTRAKGGRPAPAMRIQVVRAAGDGVVVLAASAAGEDAQESPDLGGSFFTHHLLSGMLGAADADRDGGVTIAEAYNYAYANTLRDSSATLAGSQHPSYRYDIRGQGEVVLTETRTVDVRAQLVIPAGLDVLVMRGSATGAVIAEARMPPESPGMLSLPPGRLFVRARTPRALFEQEITLRGGQTFQLATAQMDRIEFTRLARKGGSHVPFVAGVGVSLLVHSGLADRRAFCSGAGVHASLVYRSISVVPRVGACRESFTAEQLSSATTELQSSLALNAHHDLSNRWSAYVGPELGLSYFRQGVTPTAGDASARNLLGGVLTVQGGADFALRNGFVIGARLLAQTYFLQLQNPTQPAAAVSAVFTYGGSLGITGYLW
ncbi:MAG: caspase family protein [Kofleriaceae bacterium]